MSRLMVFGLLCVAVGAARFVYLRGQDTNWDLFNYHFYTGYALLHGRYTQDIAAAGLQSFLHPAINVFTYLFLRHLPFPFSGWSILLIQLASLPAIALIATQIGRGLGYRQVSIAHLLAIGLCLLAPLWWSELGTSFFSSWLAPVLLWGTWLLLRCFEHPSRRSVFIAAVMFGFATGLKLTNVPFAVAAFFVLLMMYDGDRQLFLQRLLLFMVGGLCGVALVAWWYAYLWGEWKSPLFPFYNTIFQSPYTSAGSGRDMRWVFSSFSEFLEFLSGSATGTRKTSEVEFADPRILVVAVLSVLCVLSLALHKKVAPHGRQVWALLVFVGVSFTLWAVQFAYQRYLIPTELLLGLVLWILVARLIGQEWLRVAVLAAVFAMCAVMLKVPDWGHAKVDRGVNKPFSVVVPEHIASTPARYLVIGAPVSYVLPYLHEDSVFYGLNFSDQIKDLIAERLREPSSLPVRILAHESEVWLAWKSVRRFGYSRVTHAFDCAYLSTVIAGPYSVCELVPRKPSSLASGVLVNATYVEAELSRKKGVLWERGFGFPQPWGRWTAGNTVSIGLQACLPQERLRLSVTAQASPSRVGVPVSFRLGPQVATGRFTASPGTTSMVLDNRQACADRLTISIPPEVPGTQGSSSAPGQSGLGIIRIEIVKD